MRPNAVPVSSASPFLLRSISSVPHVLPAERVCSIIETDRTLHHDEQDGALPGGPAAWKHQGVGASLAEHLDVVRIQRELLRAGGTDGAPSVGHRRELGAR